MTWAHLMAGACMYLPIDNTHRGSGIWSYTLRNAGAILFVNVPATIMTSAWRCNVQNVPF